jgi:RNase H-like domain found in reverse transcriptase
MCLYSDASYSGWAAVLTHVPASDMKLDHADRDHQPLAFLGVTFRGASCNWSVIENEALAVIRSLTTLDSFCMTDAGVTIYTDHHNLVYLFNPLSAEPGIQQTASLGYSSLGIQV